jgi:hypothetical protein
MAGVERFLKKFAGEKGLTFEEKMKVVREYTTDIPPLSLNLPEGLPFGIELTRQKERLVSLGFHKRLKLTEQEYRDSLPKFTSQPEAFRGRMDIPVLVDPRISLKTQYKLMGLRYGFDKTVKVKDWENDPKGYRTPKSPYVVWLRLDGESPRKIRETLASDERGGTVLDCAAFYVAHPEILGAKEIMLPGTTVDYSEAKPSITARIVEFILPGLTAIRADKEELVAIFDKEWESVGVIPSDWVFPRHFSMVCGRQ